MLICHRGKSPRVHPSAWVADDATVCGDVEIGADTMVMHGARIVAENGGRITIGNECIVLENAVIRATQRHNCAIGPNCVIGPNCHVVGADIAKDVFIATGSSVFHGARLEQGVEVRVNAVVHIATVLEQGATVPIGWVAVGNPAQLFSPERHEEIWERQKPLNFPYWVYGVDRNAPGVMEKITREMSEALASHRQDEPCAPARDK